MWFLLLLPSRSRQVLLYNLILSGHIKNGPARQIALFQPDIDLTAPQIVPSEEISRQNRCATPTDALIVGCGCGGAYLKFQISISPTAPAHSGVPIGRRRTRSSSSASSCPANPSNQKLTLRQVLYFLPASRFSFTPPLTHRPDSIRLLETILCRCGSKNSTKSRRVDEPHLCRGGGRQRVAAA